MSQNQPKRRSDPRTVDDIFRHLGEMAAKRGYKQDDVIRSPRCLCEEHGRKGYYIRQTEFGRLLDVCPVHDPQRTCLKCSGSGNVFIKNIRTGTSEVVPSGCDCLALRKSLERYNATLIPGKYIATEFIAKGYSFLSDEQSNLLMDIQNTVYNYCDYADSILKKGVASDDKYFLVLMGPVGTGKTHLAICALRRLILDMGHTGRFVDFTSLLHDIKDAYSKKRSEEDIIKPLRKTDVLLIDEFGKGRSESEWQLEKLDDLVNSRYNEGKVTLITTNYLSPEGFVRWKQEEGRSIQRKSLLPAKLAAYDNSEEAKSGAALAESYHDVDLRQRIGNRMYDRLVECGVFVNLTGLPSFRKHL